jgi:hypothetical protein
MPARIPFKDNRDHDRELGKEEHEKNIFRDPVSPARAITASLRAVALTNNTQSCQTVTDR